MNNGKSWGINRHTARCTFATHSWSRSVSSAHLWSIVYTRHQLHAVFLQQRQRLCVQFSACFLELHKFSDWFQCTEIEIIYTTTVDWRCRWKHTAINSQPDVLSKFFDEATIFLNHGGVNMYGEHQSCVC